MFLSEEENRNIRKACQLLREAGYLNEKDGVEKLAYAIASLLADKESLEED